MTPDLVVVSADVDDTLRFELHVNRIISADELWAIGNALIQGAEKIKADATRTKQ